MVSPHRLAAHGGCATNARLDFMNDLDVADMSHASTWLSRYPTVVQQRAGTTLVAWCILQRESCAALPGYVRYTHRDASHQVIVGFASPNL